MHKTSRNLNIREFSVENVGFEPQNRLFYETIYSQGNGYIGLRGFGMEEEKKNSYSRTAFIAGLYEYIKPGITDILNTPDFLSTVITFEGERVLPNKPGASDFRQQLDMQSGILERQYAYTTAGGVRLTLSLERFLSLADRHIGGTRIRVHLANGNGLLTIQTGIDADISNNPISDAQLEENKDVISLYDTPDLAIKGDGGLVTLTTKVTKKVIGEGYHVAVSGADHSAVTDGKNKGVYTKITCRMQAGDAVAVEKLISVYTSVDPDTSDVRTDVAAALSRAISAGFSNVLQRHKDAWAKKWDVADIRIQGDEVMQGAVRYTMFQMIGTDAEDNPNVSIGARGLMHGRYKGCAFWDTEIFMMPFYLYTNPKAAKNLLLYRYNRLQAAERNAGFMTLEGARYPWMSSDEGNEQCESWDTGACEIHITADIAYALNQYVSITGDTDFLVNYAAEMYIQTARYWCSRFTYDPVKDVYNLLFVKGPDEYCGVTANNTYTNYMASSNIRLAIDAIRLLKEKCPEQWRELSAKLNFRDEELKKWEHVADKAVILFDKEKNLYIEDENIMRLEPLDVQSHKTDNKPLYRKISFDRLQRYRVLKQADVVLLMTLFPRQFTGQQKRAAWDFYEPITLHDSTLSYGTHALMAGQLDLGNVADEYWHKSLFLDLEDIMENTGEEGIHFAALGETWKALVFGFAGLLATENGLTVHPHLPKGISAMEFTVAYQGDLWDVSIKGEDYRIVKREPSATESQVAAAMSDISESAKAGKTRI